MNRISRGFHRIGVVVSAPIAVAAIVMGFLAYQERSAELEAFELGTKERELAASKRIFEFKDDKGATFQVEAPDQESAAAAFARFKKMEPNAPPPPAGYVLESEPGPSARYPKRETNPFEDLIPKPPKSFMQHFAMSLLTLALSLISYLAIRSLGWIIAGFMRDPEGTN